LLTGGTFADGGGNKKTFSVADDGSQNINVVRTHNASGLLVSANTLVSDNVTTFGSGLSYPWNPSVQPLPLANTTLVMNAMPKGTVLLWVGDPAHVPSGWNICDGTNGTVNLANRFPLGYTPGAIIGNQGGGLGPYTISITVSGTTGTPSGANNIVQSGGYIKAMGVDHTHQFSGSGSTNLNLTYPPYTYVYYIQKLN